MVKGNVSGMEREKVKCAEAKGPSRMQSFSRREVDEEEEVIGDSLES